MKYWSTLADRRYIHLPNTIKHCEYVSLFSVADGCQCEAVNYIIFHRSILSMQPDWNLVRRTSSESIFYMSTSIQSDVIYSTRAPVFIESGTGLFGSYLGPSGTSWGSQISPCGFGRVVWWTRTFEKWPSSGLSWPRFSKTHLSNAVWVVRHLQRSQITFFNLIK